MNQSTTTVLILGFLWLFAGWAVGGQTLGWAKSNAGTAVLAPRAADSLLLDQYPNAYAAHSLQRLRSDYDGPVIRVRRGSDDAERDFGFTNGDKLEVSAVESWLAGANGYVVRWYNQVQGEPDLVQSDASSQPFIARGGTVETDSDGRIAIKFDRSRATHMDLDGSLSQFAVEQALSYIVSTRLEPSIRQTIYALANRGGNGRNTLRFTQWENDAFMVRNGVSSNSWWTGPNPAFWAVNHDGTSQKHFGNNAVYTQDNIDGSASASGLTVGARATDGHRAYEGYLSEIAILPGKSTEQGVMKVYDVANAAWDLGPAGYHPEALLPQKAPWQVELYDWLETLSEDDVTLPDGTLTYDFSYDSEDELADLWMQISGLSASSVTRREPGWYVLDNGNGKGIEATGEVRANHNPKGPGGYGGNPPRSWQNEPAMWYKTNISLSDGSQGNPWYQNAAMGRRAMVVSAVDMMMHVDHMDDTASGWFDMVGKAFLSLAEAYRWAGDVMPSETREAYERGMEEILDHLIEIGPRGVNTNMDMFALRGAAQFYMATDDAARKEKCLQLVKRSLFGYKDGKLGSKHRVFGAGQSRDGGVFSPSGFIMEGDQPDIFYGGESMVHLAGALAAVTDRSTGSVPDDWVFLEEVVRRLQEWRSYQSFYDPATKGQGTFTGAQTFVTAGSGFSGRTSHSVPKAQGDVKYKSFTIADRFPNLSHIAWVPTVSGMENGISEKLSMMNTRMSSRYAAENPEVWSGWSPWTKKTPYLPPEGWYSRFNNLEQNNDPRWEEPPPAREGEFWNKTFGGPPTGKEYWSYKQEDANGESWGFFVEAQAHQGGYGGWYGGKVETFWTESAGVVLLNRHGKTGCDGNKEDSTCWDNLDEKAGHHVWGRDENGRGFTTLLIRGRNLTRTSVFDTDGSPPTVTVNNVFNDPNNMPSPPGEETGSELEGSVEVENKFEAQSDGLKVTHTLTSDETDEVTELWASLPVYLRHYDPSPSGDDLQDGLEDTTIDYWDGSQWVELPFDADSDGVPEMVTTGALRLGRDYEGLAGNNGSAYVYVALASSQDVRRSENIYQDPYQTAARVRTVHLDLHGDPGTTKSLPANKSVSYTLQTTDPTSEQNTSTRQVISLQKGWNIVSTFVSPDTPAMDSVFAGLQSEVTVVENQAGEYYRPSEGINEIGQWSSEQAYAVHAKSDTDLSIEGDSLGSNSVVLEQGWNWVPYFPESSLSVEEAVSSIVVDLVLMKDENGRVYSPEKGIERLDQMEPGDGYKIYVRQSTTLDYPDNSN